MGGPTIRAARLGDRFSMKFDCRTLSYPQGIQFVSFLNQGYSNLLRCYIPQPLLGVGEPGTPVVNGANQAGTSLVIQGCTSEYQVGPGQFFNVITNGVYYTHQIIDIETASGGGQITVPFIPMLRASPNDGDLIIFDFPMIEGYLQSTSVPWTVDIAGGLNLSFTIKEAQ